jgi:hypothetical protein
VTDPVRNLDRNRLLARRAFLRGTLALTASGAAIYAVGCGSDDSSDPTATAGAPTSAPTSMAQPTAGATAASTANPQGISPVLLTSEYIAGRDNRFVVGLLDGAGKLVLDANVHLRFFTIGDDGVSGTLRGEGDAAFTQLNIEGAHTHDSTTGAASSDDAISFYVANAPFDQAGKWGVQVIVTPDNGGQPAQIQVPLDVLAKSSTPDLGQTPPASQNDTTATNADPSSLCSRKPPCNLHDKAIGDVLGKGRPLVVQVSTPAFCQTRFCGPVLEVLLDKVPQYQDRVDFVHIEVWQDFQLQKYRPAMTEWRLTTEPWTFFMDKTGKVVLKLESIFSEEELSSALDQLAAL